MRNIGGVLFLVFVMFGCGQGEQNHVTSDMLNFPATASGEIDDDGPKIVFEQDTFHFEMMAVGTSVQHTFRFKNEGNAPLIISHVQPSCGCTALKDWPQQPLAPGSDGQITIEFNATGSEGSVDKTILVATNAEPKDKILHIQGKIIGVEVEHKGAQSGVQMQRER
jgi:Protein of unknown function (DUF1573)